jgi:hypothetical protein|tara:strand:+ start:541 stop:705 length:165 start_codon:yes stop_codon:yes gene_type:complete
VTYSSEPGRRGEFGPPIDLSDRSSNQLVKGRFEQPADDLAEQPRAVPSASNAGA